MSDKSRIEWTDASWNPVRGTKGRHHCVRVSEGCKHCYAATMNHRFGGPDYVKGADTPRLDEEALLQPLKWTKPRRIFVCSMTDLFMDEHSDEMIDQVFGVMAASGRHTFQVLTKRSRRMRDYILGLADKGGSGRGFKRLEAAAGSVGFTLQYEGHPLLSWPIPNVWLGVSAENQERADQRIPDLLATPAAVRFVSAEPLLSGINFDALPRPFEFHQSPHGWMAWLAQRLHWVIVGGESGSGARPCDVSWIRSIKDQCKAAEVPVFVKQLGVAPLGGDGLIYVLKDRKGGDPAEWPADLRVREMPYAR